MQPLLPGDSRAYVAANAEEKFTYQAFPSCIPDLKHKHWTIIESKVQLSRAILHHGWRCWFNANELENCELLNIQRSSIKLLYAQLSKTKAFLFIRPEVVDEWISESEQGRKSKKTTLKFLIFENCWSRSLNENKQGELRTWTLKLYYSVISNRE